MCMVTSVFVKTKKAENHARSCKGRTNELLTKLPADDRILKICTERDVTSYCIARQKLAI